jgi:hypothetical protein
VTFREYMSFDTNARKQIFNRVSARKKAERVREQVESWRPRGDTAGKHHGARSGRRFGETVLCSA